MIRVKRIYDGVADEDGARVLVDRLWPRGVSKEAARLDWWARELAPSSELRKRFHGHAETYREFVRAYRDELAGNPALSRLRELAASRTVTLLFAARDAERNNATALAEILAPRR
ncbi:MAG TPA: DUF488 family protein [Thermoanaerobaculaceae bacterium]|nr:DUF488 family protein [Thermoanaerobaculaceae bacterium]